MSLRGTSAWWVVDSWCNKQDLASEAGLRQAMHDYGLKALSDATDYGHGRAAELVGILTGTELPQDPREWLSFAFASAQNYNMFSPDAGRSAFAVLALRDELAQLAPLTSFEVAEAIVWLSLNRSAETNAVPARRLLDCDNNSNRGGRRSAR